MKNLLIFCILFILFACEVNEKQEATINYYLTSTSHKTYEYISFQFDHTRAHRNQMNEIRTVYLDPKKVNFDLSDPDKISLGSSTIEPEVINGYNFGFSSFNIIKQNDTIELAQPFGYNNYTEFSLEPSEAANIDVTFILDINTSIVLDSAGKDWIKPRIIIKN